MTNLLLTNDDGIDAPGLAALEAAVGSLGRVVTVAPHQGLSGCSHQVTTDRPLMVRQIAPGRHALHGTPADCTRLGLLHLAPDVDWVLAGINDGGNLGVDVHMSGTVAAVREATLLGKPAIALSQYRSGRQPLDWARAARLVRQVLDQLLHQPPPAGTFWNVNLPDLPDPEAMAQVVFCNLDPHSLPVEYELRDGQFHYRADYQSRRRTPGCDVDVCFSGSISVTRVGYP